MNNPHDGVVLLQVFAPVVLFLVIMAQVLGHHHRKHDRG